MSAPAPTIGSTFGDDSPRAGRLDSLSSHVGADVSARNRQRVLDAVYILITQEGPLDGSDLNDLYRRRARRNGWPTGIHFDSPRKRAGELAAAGRVVILNEDDPRGTPHVYSLPAMKEAA